MFWEYLDEVFPASNPIHRLVCALVDKKKKKKKKVSSRKHPPRGAMGRGARDLPHAEGGVVTQKTIDSISFKGRERFTRSSSVAK